MKPGQSTPCGAMPDSGTTLMMAPAEHIGAVLDSLCDAWHACAQEAAQNDQPKYMVTQQLMMNCDSWDDNDFAALPSLYFHMADSTGRKEVLEIPSSAYIMTVDADQLVSFLGNTSMAASAFYKRGGRHAAGEKLCIPAFGELNYQTKTN